MVNDEWETPTWLFNKLHREFHFNLDVAATLENSKCLKYFTKEDNALVQEWNGRCFMNPPYSRNLIGRFIGKAYHEVLHNRHCELVVGILPTRTSTKYFHAYIQDKAEIRFLKGRVKFCLNGVQSKNSPREDTMIIIWRKYKQWKEVLRNEWENQGYGGKDLIEEWKIISS